MKDHILTHLTADCPWRDTLCWYEQTDSTNTRAKELAKAGAPHGTVLVAKSQTGGRGRMGRSFLSPIGGVYLSVILRPGCYPENLMHLTCAVAVAACNAVEEACGVRPSIKWTNDLVSDKKKLGGILTELSLDGKGNVEFAIIGIGINCEKPNDLPAELQDTVTSIQEISDGCTTEYLTAKLIEALWKMDLRLFTGKQEMMTFYREHCITLGKEIKVIRGDYVDYGTALDIDEDGGLLVRFRDGKEKVVASGEVSVRGMYGYL